MSKTIEIHEFSTGIAIIETADDWVVGGFTGNYLHSTLKSVPVSVQNAIASQYFAVAESTSSDKPAVIGREIIGADGDWSVVAVVTKGTDNMGRTASLYRYFLCQRAGNIHYILQWMNQEKKRILVFDPFDEQTVGNPHRYKITSSNSINVREGLESLLDGSPTVIVPSQEPCAPIILNEMANRLGQPVSWAYHVKGVVNPTFFQIIQPVDSQSEQIIRLAIARTPKRPQLQGEEQPITTAIKGLTNREKFKPEHIQTIEKALANDRIKNESWKDLFEQQGAKDVINNKIYTLSTVRLLTLQALVLPETLPIFLSWIQQTNNKKHHDISRVIQNQIYKYYLQGKINLLKEKSREGVITIIPHLVEEPNLIDPLVWLLEYNKGIWGCLYQNKIMPEIEQDFQSIAQCYRTTRQNSVNLKVLNHSDWQSIYKDLQAYLQPNTTNYRLAGYQPIADLFYKLQKVNKSYRQLQLHALFLYISQSKIPKKLFSNLERNKKSPDGIYVYVYGVPLEREVPRSEQLYLTTKLNVQNLYSGTVKNLKKLWFLQIRLPLVLFLMLATLLVGIYHKKIPIIGNIGSTTDSSTTRLSKAFDKFGRTKKVIKEEIYQPLFEEFNSASNNPNELRMEIINAISKTLAPKNKFSLDYSVIEKEDLVIENNPEVKKWIEAIYAYQENKKIEVPNITVAGYLLRNGLTNEPLKNDIRDNIDPKFKTEEPDAPLSEAFDRFQSTRKVIKEEIYQPLFDEFQKSNDPQKLREGIINAIRKTLDPEGKISSQYKGMLQYTVVIEKEDLVVENNLEVKKWIEAIYAYQENKKIEVPNITVAGYLLRNSLTNELLINDIRDNIDQKYKPTTPKDSNPPRGE